MQSDQTDDLLDDTGNVCDDQGICALIEMDRAARTQVLPQYGYNFTARGITEPPTDGYSSSCL